jgi:DNA-binding CsgD family transcriptional regulator
MISSKPTPEPPRTLRNVVSDPAFAQRALDIIQKVPAAGDEGEVVELLTEAKYSLGAEHAAFASFVRDDETKESFRFFVACDPQWCLEYLQHGWYAHDPWLLYACTNSEPASASTIPLRTPTQRAVRCLAAKYGIASAYIVPAPSAPGLTRIGALMLGSMYEGYFEGQATAPIKVLARSLAMELHEWWVRKVRHEVIEKCRLTPEDLQLLTFERQGLGSKQIAAKLNTSPSAVDSRFQRLNAKFNMPTRRATARVAAEYGLI